MTKDVKRNFDESILGHYITHCQNKSWSIIQILGKDPLFQTRPMVP